jgi:hypothetical protein
MALLPLGFVVALVGPAPEPPAVRATCAASWCHAEGMQAEIDAMIAGQLHDLGCDTRRRLTDRVAVRNAHRPDTGVVRVVSFDEAYRQAKAGAVWVVGYCG